MNDSLPLLFETASTSLEKGDLAKSQAAFESVVDLVEKEFGHEHPSTGRALHNLAIVARRQGDLHRARELYQQALAIKETSEDPTKSFSCAQTLDGIGLTEFADGRLDEATEVFKRSLAIYEQVCAPHVEARLDASTNLVEVANAAGDYKRAVLIALAALAKLDPKVRVMPQAMADAVALLNLLDQAVLAAMALGVKSPCWGEAFELRHKIEARRAEQN